MRNWREVVQGRIHDFGKGRRALGNHSSEGPVIFERSSNLALNCSITWYISLEHRLF